MLAQLFALYLTLVNVPIPEECATEIAYFDAGLTDDGHTPEGPESACAARYFQASLELDESFDWRAAWASAWGFDILNPEAFDADCN